MVNNKIAQRAVAAGLSGLMAFGAAAPAALAYSPQNFKWYKVNSSDDGVYWKRLAGDDRYGTMKEIVKAYNEFERVTGISIYGTKTESDYNYHATAVIASGDNFPDALAANGLAGYLTNMNLTVNGGNNGSVPVILTKSGKLSNEAKDLLKGMQVQEAIVMGGTAAVSQDVEDAIAKLGIRVSRIAGKDRQETSLKALQAINGNWKGRKGTWDLIIATGKNYADALSISPYAYRMGTPVVLTNSDGTLTDAQVEAIRSNDDIKEIVIVGGTDAVSDQVMGQIGTINKNKVGVQYHRIAGADRYETSAKIAQFEVEAWTSLWNGIAGFTFDHAIVATGENFPDALAGGQLAGGIGDILDPINVKDFTGINEWSPCPLLLVKDGDVRAENMIAWGIGRDRVTSNTATYASFKSWQNTVNGWYGNSTTEYKKLVNNWYASAAPFYVSLNALENILNTQNKQDVVATITDEISYKINAKGDDLEGPTLTVNGVDIPWRTNTITKADIDNNASGFGYVLSGSKVAGIHYWYTDPVTGVKYNNTTVKDTTTATDSYGAYTLTAADQTPGTHTILKQYKYGKPGKATVSTPPAVIAAWDTEIIGCVDWDEDFYGIILGGTSAVSNKKRDDLDDIVKDTVRDANVFTVGSDAPNTVTLFSEGLGINVDYARLIPVKVDVRGKTGSTYGTGRFADVFRVAGTDSYIVYVTDGDDNFVDWCYYYGGAANTTFVADWE